MGFASDEALDAVAMAELARRREVSPRELVDEAIARIGRSVAGASFDVQREFGLQRALIAALLVGDPVTARAELGRTTDLMPPDGYDALTLAAILLAEAKRDEAAKALARWTRDAAASRFWEAGNEWALDRLDAALTREAPAKPS